MRKSLMNMYSGQAIAIVMVILVVAAVLGASLYSRTIKNTESVVDQQDSDVALEVADNILDYISSEVPFSQLSTLSNQDKTYSQSQISTLESDLGLSAGSLLGSINQCGDGEDSSISINITRTEPTEYIDVQAGTDRSFNFENSNVTTTPCSFPISVKAAGTQSYFAIKKIYQNKTTKDVKDYEEDDIQAYCVSEGSTCNDDSFQPQSSATHVNSGDSVGVNIDTIGGYQIYEIKVIPLKGDISVSYQAPTCLTQPNLSYVKIVAGVNCHGSYREKQIVFPSSESLGYSALFDYSIYNMGELSPR